MSGDYARLEAARRAREALAAGVHSVERRRAASDSGWVVARNYDDGRVELVRDELDCQGADVLAGNLRDRMSEADCEAGFNFQSMSRSSFESAQQQARSFVQVVRDQINERREVRRQLSAAFARQLKVGERPVGAKPTDRRRIREGGDPA